MDRGRILWRYFALSAAALLVNVGFYLPYARVSGFLAALFAAAACGTVALLLAFPVHLLALLRNRLVSLKRLDGLFSKRPWTRDAVVYAGAVIGTSGLQIFLYFDRFIYGLYGFHLN